MRKKKSTKERDEKLEEKRYKEFLDDINKTIGEKDITQEDISQLIETYNDIELTVPLFQRIVFSSILRKRDITEKEIIELRKAYLKKEISRHVVIDLIRVAAHHKYQKSIGLLTKFILSNETFSTPKPYEIEYQNLGLGLIMENAPRVNPTDILNIVLAYTARIGSGYTDANTTFIQLMCMGASPYMELDPRCSKFFENNGEKPLYYVKDKKTKDLIEKFYSDIQRKKEDWQRFESPMETFSPNRFTQGKEDSLPFHSLLSKSTKETIEQQTVTYSSSSQHIFSNPVKEKTNPVKEKNNVSRKRKRENGQTNQKIGNTPHRRKRRKLTKTHSGFTR